MDPALTDRTIRPILGISHTTQPVRPMIIPGIEQRVHARILSTNPRASATRIVRLESGWGTRLAGAFTAAVEVFVLKGDLILGPVKLTDYEYALIPSGGVVGGFRTEMGAIALIMTSGPVRYDSSSGGAAAVLAVGRPVESRWEREWPGVDLFVRPLATTAFSQVWVGSTQLSSESEIWHRHAHDEETFVLEGTFSCVDRLDGEAVMTSAEPGSYFYRPAGTQHTAPAALGQETVLTFHRSLGPHENELIEGDVS
jgi:mannose-6-phosphate isomerase-like protein (cupin superfamily)